jgi:hypothetical protein
MISHTDNVTRFVTSLFPGISVPLSQPVFFLSTFLRYLELLVYCISYTTSDPKLSLYRMVTDGV